MAFIDKKVSALTRTNSLSNIAQADMIVNDNTQEQDNDKTRLMSVEDFKTALNIAGGMTANERANQNNLIKDVARLNYENSLNAIAYKGGTYDLLADSAKIASTSQVTVSTLDGGAPNGKVELGFQDEGWQIQNPINENKSYNFNSKETDIRAIRYNADGSKVFIAGNTTDSVHQFSLSDNYNINTVTDDNISFSFSSQTTDVLDLYFSSDGLKMYVLCGSNDIIYQYNMSVDYGISEASYSNKSFYVGNQENQPQAICIGDNNTKLYVCGDTNNTIYQYNLATSGDINTASFSGASFNYASTVINVWTMFMRPNGSSFFLMGLSNYFMHQFDTVINFNVNSLSYIKNSNINGGQVACFVFRPDGYNYYIGARSTNIVAQFSSIDLTSEYLSSGNFVTTAIDLTADLSEAPNQVVVSSEFATPTDTTLSVTISDGTNDVTITSANFDTEVDCSALTTRTLTATWNLATSDTASTPTITNYALYFTT